jgi:hypothetical protein
LIADRLADEGFSVMITPVRTDNIPSRRAVEKVGFREVAVMDHWRIGPRRRTSVQPFDDQLGQELAARLSGRATGSRSFVKWTSTSADWG